MLDKLSLTLYDLLVSILPGYVLIFTLSVIEATFIGSSVICLSRINDNPFIFTVIAYFLGQASHSTGDLVKKNFGSLFKDKNNPLSTSGKPTEHDNVLYEIIINALKSTYHIQLAPNSELNDLQVTLLADNYVLAKGGSQERDIMIAREGFFKASMIAFGIFSLTSLVSVIMKGKIVLQTVPGNITTLYCGAAIIILLISVFLTYLFMQRFIFFNRIRKNLSLLLFLALTKCNNNKDIIN